jgi:SAM-dependent methyltransferase
MSVSGAAADYVFDTAVEAERARLRAQSELWDDFTFRRLDATGVGEGWRCLEIGAAAGTVATWLVGRVGRTGQVVATDIETRWLAPLACTNLEVRHHNVNDHPLEPEGYDLIHSRLVLEHLPQRDRVLAKLVGALRPGGHLVVEDYDIRTMQLGHGTDEHWVTINRAVLEVLRASGIDLTWGQRLPSALRRAGLLGITTEGVLHALSVAELGPVFRPALEQVAPRLMAAGAVTGAQVDAVLKAFDKPRPDVLAYTPVLVSSGGRAPGR